MFLQPCKPRKRPLSLAVSRKHQSQQRNQTNRHPCQPETDGGELDAFSFFGENDTVNTFVPTFVNGSATTGGNEQQQQEEPNVDICVPLAPCVYRMTDCTLAKKEPVTVARCLAKLGVLPSLERECGKLSTLLWGRLSDPPGKMEEDELGKPRFMELLSTKKCTK